MVNVNNYAILLESMTMLSLEWPQYDLSYNPPIGVHEP